MRSGTTSLRATPLRVSTRMRTPSHYTSEHLSSMWIRYGVDRSPEKSPIGAWLWDGRRRRRQRTHLRPISTAAGDHESEAACRASAAITAYGIGLSDPTGPLDAMLARLGVNEYLASARVHLGLAWLAATFAFPTRALRHLEHVDRRALEEASDIALRFHNVSAFVAMTLGDLATFRREHAAWIAAAQATGSLQKVATAYTNGAMCYSVFGLHEEAQESLDRAFESARQANSSHDKESAHAFAAMCYLMRGDLRLARDELDRVSTASENRVNITFATAWGTVVGAALGDDALIEKWFDGFESGYLRRRKSNAEQGSPRSWSGGAAAMLPQRC